MGMLLASRSLRETHDVLEPHHTAAIKNKNDVPSFKSLEVQPWTMAQTLRRTKKKLDDPGG